MSLLFAMLVGCGEATPEVPADPGPAVLQSTDVVEAYLRPIATGPRISGSLEAALKAVLRAEASGSVSEIAAELGDEVAEGALLARIENDAIRQQLDAASSSFAAAEQDAAVAERDLERTRTLTTAGALSPRDLDLAQSGARGAQARLLAARAGVAGARELFDGIVLRSPITGVVSQRSINVGDIVSPGAPLFTVIDPTSLRLEGTVPAEAVGSVSQGTPVRFEVQGFPGRTFDGIVERVAPAVDAATRQIPILVSIPNADRVLVAGLFADGQVATEIHEGVVVPLDAVDTSAPRPYVLRVRSDVVERAEVELGLVDDATQEVEVTAGLAAGDKVIVGAARDVEPGRAVRVDEHATAAAAEG